MKKYFDVHCEFNGDFTSYSIPVEIETNNDSLNGNDIIKYCVDNKLFTEIGDENYVDKITEIDFEEYQKLTK